jgi:hypothetical protein
MEDFLIDITDFIDDGEIDENSHEAIRTLYNSICNKDINSSNIMNYVVYLMKIIDTFKNINNIDKKKLILFVLNKFIDINIADENEKNLLKAFIESILPHLIDTLVSLDNKEIVIKTKNYIMTFKEKLMNCFICCSD